jgi:dTDP-glucose pyrophosphorylase
MHAKFDNLKIQCNTELVAVLKRMDELMRKLLLVFEGQKFIGLVSIGDIQRAIIKDLPLTTEVRKIIRSDYTHAVEGDSPEMIRKLMLQKRTECMPVLDKNRNLIEVFFWEDLFTVNEKRIQRSLNIPVVIMAGGKGTRLKPITNVLPKPLIPIGEKTILEIIMDSFLEVDCNNFYLSLNYKANMIEYYFRDYKQYNMTYLKEEIPMGTAGSLSLLRDKINSTFFLSNCDIIVDLDLCDLFDFHKENNNELTIVAALKHYSIPYGTLETGPSGLLVSFSEKPEFTYKINSGLYVIEPSLLNEIPDNKYFHITELIEKILKRKGRVGVFPVSENSWKDIGNWESYLPNRFSTKNGF